jgi:uncharacterized protein YecT (DUF1311 family)
MAARTIVLGLLVLLSLPMPAGAQSRQPTAQENAAVRACATKNADNIDAGEQQCLFTLVAAPCLKAAGSADAAMTDCYDIEGMIGDQLLNENYKTLLGTPNDEQTTAARAMQRAWIAYRDTTCQFYDDKIRGSMSIMMHAACVTRETARRAMLLRFFSGL